MVKMCMVKMGQIIVKEDPVYTASSNMDIMGLSYTHTYCMIDSPHEDTKNWITGSEHSLLLVLRLEVLLHFTFRGSSRHSTIKQSNHKMIIIIIVTLM